MYAKYFTGNLLPISAMDHRLFEASKTKDISKILIG
jgi:hypothetical protein